VGESSLFAFNLRALLGPENKKDISLGPWELGFTAIKNDL